MAEDGLRQTIAAVLGLRATVVPVVCSGEQASGSVWV